MSTVISLTQHLLKLEPSRNVARLAFYNYLKSFFEPSTPVTRELIEQTSAFLLNFHFWQGQSKLLGESIAQDLSSWGLGKQGHLDWSGLVLPHELQLIRLEKTQDLLVLVERLETQALEPNELIKLIPTKEQQVLCLRLTRSGGLRARTYNPLALIREGQLKPLPPVVDLVYSSDMELFPLLPQLVDGPMLLTARFQITDEGCHGVMTRGHTLQKYETFSHGRLSQHPELMFAVKRVEKYFIDPLSDPFYRDLVQTLERAIPQAQSGRPELIRLAKAALQRGQSAFKALYSEDKKLTILLTHLEYALLQMRPQADASAADASKAELPYEG